MPILTDSLPSNKFDTIEEVTPIAKIEAPAVATSVALSAYSSTVLSVQPTASATLSTQLATSVASTTSIASAIPPTQPANSIVISDRMLPIFRSSDTKTDAGTQVGHYRNLLYCHNSATVFGFLADLPLGTTFTVNLDGVSTTYKIVDKLTISRTALETNNRMNYLTNSASYVDHSAGISIDADVVLMTCAGTSYGNGDASHRTLVFADKV